MAKKSKVPRYKNTKFLKALGARCKELRVKSGYSLDRIYREGDQLSTSSIHRLENGDADTQISVFYRYAQVIGVSLQELFNFNLEEKISDKILPYDSENKERPKLSVPYYDIKVAAGLFSKDTDISEKEPVGWVKIENHRNLNDFFATHVVGNSMEPGIPSGSLCLFKMYRGGSRQNKVFLVRARGLSDPETNSSYVVKKYKRVTQHDDHEHRAQAVVHLISENKAYSPIILMASSENEIDVIAEFIEVLDED